MTVVGHHATEEGRAALAHAAQEAALRGRPLVVVAAAGEAGVPAPSGAEFVEAASRSGSSWRPPARCWWSRPNPGPLPEPTGRTAPRRYTADRACRRLREERILRLVDC